MTARSSFPSRLSALLLAGASILLASTHARAQAADPIPAASPDAATVMKDFKDRFNACDDVAKYKDPKDQNACRLAVLNFHDNTLDVRKATQTIHLFGANTFDPANFHQRIVFQRYANIHYDNLVFRIGIGFFVLVNNDARDIAGAGTYQSASATGNENTRNVSLFIRSLGIAHPRIQELMPVAPEITESFLNSIGKAFVDGFNPDPQNKYPGILQDPSADLHICPQVIDFDDPKMAGLSPEAIRQARNDDKYKTRIRRDIGDLTKITNHLASCEKIVPNTLTHFFSVSQQDTASLTIPLLFSASDTSNTATIVQEYRRYRFVDGYGTLGASAIYAIRGSEKSATANPAASIGAAIINFSNSDARVRAHYLIYGSTGVTAIPAVPSDPSYNYIFSVYKSFEEFKKALKDVRVEDLVLMQNDKGEYVTPTSFTSSGLVQDQQTNTK